MREAAIGHGEFSSTPTESPGSLLVPTKPSYQTVTEAECRARLSCIRLCSRAPQVFELRTAPHPVTILSRQLRALRLADALSMFYERGETVTVAVVGGDVGGLTFAAAMMSLT